MPMRSFFHIVTLSLLLAGCASAPAPRSPANSQLDHVSICVADVDSSAAFYKSVFGLKELKNPFPGGGGVVWLDLGNGMALHIFGGRSSALNDVRERHLAITVGDMSRVTGALRSRGVVWQNFAGVAGQSQTRPDGVSQLFFRDPDGYWIEVNDALKLLAH
jgi:lactoylglutathione lyase